MKDRHLADALGLRAKDYSVCLQCHHGDLPSIEKFDAKKYWNKLPHSQTGKKGK